MEERKVKSNEYLRIQIYDSSWWCSCGYSEQNGLQRILDEESENDTKNI